MSALTRIRPHVCGLMPEKFGNSDEIYDKRIQKMNNKKKNNKINQVQTFSSRTDCKPYSCPDYKGSRVEVGATRT